jgi:hypothetical protein
MHTEEKELIDQLRNSKGWPTLGNAAADAIEALIVRIADLQAFGKQYHDGWMCAEGRLSDAEAEIGKLSSLLNAPPGVTVQEAAKVLLSAWEAGGITPGATLLDQGYSGHQATVASKGMETVLRALSEGRT